MILLYQKYNDKLKELRTIPYWVKLLEDDQYKDSHFWILQLLLAAITVQDKNIK